MKVLITGSTGLVGSALAARLRLSGHACVLLSRGGAPGTLKWDMHSRELPEGALGGVDAVVHLAGESIAGGRWSQARKRSILESRVRSTGALAAALARLEPPPALVCASAVGYYGDRGDAVLTEAEPPGNGFLAQVCREWEAAAEPAAAAGARTVRARLGLVLSPRGGLLARLRPLFEWGVAGALGSGRQYMSWVALADVAQALVRAVEDGSVRGPLNVTSPHPVTNAEFTRELARAVRRWVGPPVPRFAARLAFGSEMADELFFASTRAVPARLLELGQGFRFPELRPALESLIREPRA